GLANVSQLTQVRGYTGASTPPVVVGGTLYALTGNGILQAFDAKGVSGCTGSPTVCSPLWKSSAAAGRSITVDKGKVYAVGISGLQVYDAAGASGCGGTPKVCAPLWTTGTFTSIGPGSPAVANGVVYVTGGRSILPAPGNAYVIAYDANGSANCIGTVCSPLWWSTAAPTDVLYSQALAVANGLVYAADGSQIVAFDVNGSSGCSGSPNVCSPLWSTSPPTSLAYGGPAVSGGTLFVAGYGGTIYAYDAAGTNGCSGSPKTCSPMWSASVGDTRNTPAVSNGIVYVANVAGALRAFDATGATGCSGSPKVCTPLWTYAPSVSGYVVTGSPAGANGVVYTVTPDSNFHALDAAGSIGCSGTPKTCSPQWSTNPGKISTDASPAIVDGTVYWNSGTVSTTWAYELLAAGRSRRATPRCPWVGAHDSDECDRPGRGVPRLRRSRWSA
ncbi:MAG: outer membrane protein assembly factor BamB family protein, partial [Acidimicrobiales bacterium]